jgi:hypothetical protein
MSPTGLLIIPYHNVSDSHDLTIGTFNIYMDALTSRYIACFAALLYIILYYRTIPEGRPYELARANLEVSLQYSGQPVTKIN